MSTCFYQNSTLTIHMNPICNQNLYSRECQLWMSKVCARCKDLLVREASDAWAAWWHDDTPAIYKDVSEMTVYDCTKLKRSLQIDVATVAPTVSTATSYYESFRWWQKLFLVIIYGSLLIFLITMCHFWLKRHRAASQPIDEEKQLEPTAESVSSDLPEDLLPVEDIPRPKSRKNTLRGWMRNRCRPIFVHNEAALRRQQLKYKERELLRDIHTHHNILKWTKGRERANKKGKVETVQPEEKHENHETHDKEINDE